MDEAERPNIICGQCTFQTHKVHYLVNHTKKKHDRKMSHNEIIAIQEEIAKLNNNNNDTQIKNETNTEEEDVDDIFNNSNNIPDETRPEQDDVEVVNNTKNNNIPFENQNQLKQDADEAFYNNNCKTNPIENLHKLKQDGVISSGTETDEKRFQCELCPAVFQKLLGLTVHKTHRHSTRNCYETQINSSGQKYYKNDNANQTSNEFHQCDYCEYGNKSLRGLQVHKYRNHSLMRDRKESNLTLKTEQAPIHNQIPELISPKTEIVTQSTEYALPKLLIESLKCESCGFLTQYPKIILVHRIRKSHFEKKQVKKEQDNNSSSVNTPKNGSNFNCSKCPKAFANSRLLTLHSKMVHWSEESANIFKYKCQECSLTYKSDKSLIRHSINSHGMKDPHGASERHQSMDSNQNEEQDLPESEMINSFGILHQCSLCSSKLSSKDSLIRHMKSIHTVTKLSKCATCKEQFGSDSSMYRHIKKFHARLHPESTMQEVAVKSQNSLTSRTRSNIQNGQNNLLDYSYNLANNSSAHQSSSIGSPILYECQYCDARFMKINSLSQHEKTAHERQ